MRRSDFLFGSRDLLVIVDPQEEHTTGLNLLRNPGMRQQLQGITDIASELLEAGGQVLVTSLLIPPGACGTITPDYFAGLETGNPKAVATYEYFFGDSTSYQPFCNPDKCSPLPEGGINKLPDVASKPAAVKPPVNPGFDSRDDRTKGLDVIDSLKHHKRYNRNYFFNKEEPVSTIECVANNMMLPMQTMAPEGGAALDPHLFSFMENLPAEKQERVFLALRGYQDDGKSWMLNLHFKDQTSLSFCAWSEAKGIVNPHGDRSKWLEAYRPEESKADKKFPRRKKPKPKVTCQQTRKEMMATLLGDSDTQKANCDKAKVQRIFIVGYPLETAVAAIAKQFALPPITVCMQPVIVLAKYTWMLAPHNEVTLAAEVSSRREDPSLYDTFQPRISAESIIRQLQCSGVNVNMNDPFLSGVQVRLWEKAFLKAFPDKPINIGTTYEQNVAAKKMLQMILQGSPIAPDIGKEGERSSISSVCPDFSERIQQLILGIDVNDLVRMDTDNDSIVSARECADFLFDQFGRELHLCWLRPNLGELISICDYE